ncbi:MAG: hypothetical protein CBC01_07470 [Betaproteobacteria bacterium TMED41]|nr:MAG: hypothetical protein CBC01_07470 [Betaproteobacteria bacterium TMED41]
MSKILSFFMLIFFTSTATFGNDLDSSEKSIIEQDLSIGNSLSLESESMVEADNSNRYGFIALWKQSDWVAKGALVVLLIMSLGSWTIFVSKFFEQSKVIKECTMLKESYERGIIVSQIFKDLPKSCLLNIVYNAGKEAKLQTNTSDNSIDPANWVGEGIQSGINQVNGYLQNGLTFLATVGSTAPFVGLFGTVWAIYHALIKIGDSGQASLDKVAGPVGEALIMTAIGLAVAVPAVLGYNWLVRRNKILMEKITNFGNIFYVSFFQND